MCLPFEVYFHEIWYIAKKGKSSVTDLIRPICKIGCILGNFAKKALNLAQIGCFSAENGIIEGSQNCVFFRYREQRFFGVRQAHPRTKFGCVESCAAFVEVFVRG